MIFDGLSVFSTSVYIGMANTSHHILKKRATMAADPRHMSLRAVTRDCRWWVMLATPGQPMRVRATPEWLWWSRMFGGGSGILLSGGQGCPCVPSLPCLFLQDKTR